MPFWGTVIEESGAKPPRQTSQALPPESGRLSEARQAATPAAPLPGYMCCECMLANAFLPIAAPSEFGRNELRLWISEGSTQAES
jgi:hypothetical protein